MEVTSSWKYSAGCTRCLPSIIWYINKPTNEQWTVNCITGTLIIQVFNPGVGCTCVVTSCVRPLQPFDQRCCWQTMCRESRVEEPHRDVSEDNNCTESSFIRGKKNMPIYVLVILRTNLNSMCWCVCWSVTCSSVTTSYRVNTFFPQHFLYFKCCYLFKNATLLNSLCFSGQVKSVNCQYQYQPIASLRSFEYWTWQARWLAGAGRHVLQRRYAVMVTLKDALWSAAAGWMESGALWITAGKYSCVRSFKNNMDV